MYYRFEKLEVWKLAREFTGKIYKITNDFPKSELFGLTSQIRRASLSIALNIAEGSDRKSDIEFKRFLRISIGSIEEVVTALYIATDLDFINKEEFNILYELSCIITAKIRALMTSLKP